MAHCQLPVLGKARYGGHVLSHDQIEAVLMRRAGYEVRVLPEEGASFEQNPPTLIEFIRRDLRWCQGNMQYWHFLAMPGLKPVSRYQLAFAILMFLGSPAWIGMLLIGTRGRRAGADAGATSSAPMPGSRCFVARAGDVVRAEDRDRDRRADATRRCGAFSAAACASSRASITETIFFLLLAPIMWFEPHAVSRAACCSAARSAGARRRATITQVPWSLAARQFWPQTLLGLCPVALLAVTVPAAIPYALFIAGGPLALDPARGRHRLARASAAR